MYTIHNHKCTITYVLPHVPGSDPEALVHVDEVGVEHEQRHLLLGALVDDPLHLVLLAVEGTHQYCQPV